MREFVIEVDDDIVNTIQRAALEVSARQGVIDRYMDKHMNDSDTSALDAKPFVHFMTLLAEAEAEFELAKEAFTKYQVPDFLQEHEIEWNLDYSSKKATITVKCDCPIPELDKQGE